MKNLAFWLTDRERDALFTLDLCPAAWLNFSARTWKSLADKGLVNEDSWRGRPAIRGTAARSLAAALRTLTRPNSQAGEKKPVLPADDEAALAPARQEPLVLSERIRPGLKT